MHGVIALAVVDVMKYMDPLGKGEVTFEMFRNWLIDTGGHWSDLLVLPEGSVAVILAGI